MIKALYFFLFRPQGETFSETLVKLLYQKADTLKRANIYLELLEQ